VITTGARGDDSPQRIYSGANQALIGGATIDWERLLPWKGRPTRLPNYPWQRERYWHTVTPASMGLLDRKFEHPLLGYALNQVELTWENDIDTQRHPLLADHVVGDATVFPGTGYAEFALAAAFCWQPTAVIELEDLEIRAPLLVAEETSRTVRCALDPRDGQLSIKSREQLSQEAWTLQAVARVLREPLGTRLERALGPVPTRQPDFTGRSHALLTAAAGLKYGPSFQAVHHGWVEGAAALAIIDLPDPVRAELDRYHLHPALVDCTFQLIIQLLKDSAAEYTGLTFVPTRIGHLSYRGGMAKPQYARARLLSRGPHSVSAEFEIFDETQQPIAVIEEVRFRSVRLQRTAEQFRYFEYGAVPRPWTRTAAAVDDSSIDRLDAALTQGLAEDGVQRAHRLYAAEVDPLLDALCSRFVIEALQEMPVGARGVQAEAGDYHAHLLELVRTDGLLDPDESGVPLEDTDQVQPSARDIWTISRSCMRWVASGCICPLCSAGSACPRKCGRA
jgi:acyl transferase domain-containing protein